MRAIWKGHITFGLVNIPVSLFSAEKRSDLSFHLIDSRDHARVRYERVNADTGDEVPWNQIVKGYEYAKGSYVVIENEELKKAAPEATQSVEIEAFVNEDEIDDLFFDKPYYLEPGKKGEKGYALLREVLRDSGRVGIARVVIRTRQYMAALGVRENALTLTLMRYLQEIRETDDLKLPGDDLKKLGVTAAETKMARLLVDNMTEEWNPSQYHDEYREALVKWIEKKVEAGDVTLADEAAEPAQEAVTINLMDALKASVKGNGATKSTKSAAKKTKTKTKKKATRKKAG